MTTAADIEKLKPTGKTYKYALGRVPGFYLAVMPKGNKYFYLSYRPTDKKEKTQLKIGPAKSSGQDGFTLKQAERKAAENYALILKGINPHGEQIKKRKDLLVSELLEKYIDYQTPRKKSIKNDLGYIKNWINPALGKYKITGLTKKNVKDFHAKHQKPVTANKCIQVLRKAFNLAIHEWEIFDQLNPAASITPHLETQRVRYLLEHEKERFINALDESLRGINDPDLLAIRWRFCQCLRLLILTGARLRNIMEAKWEWVEWNRGFIKVPWEDHKTGKVKGEPLYINLSERALNLLRELKEQTNSEWVIAGQDPSKPLNGYRKMWLKILDIADLKDFRLHDLRHHYASEVANAGFSRLQVGQLLGHRSAQSTERYVHLFNGKAREINDQIASSVNV